MTQRFDPSYYDHDYFANPEGKSFTRSNGSVERWGYKNPGGEFFGARQIAQAWHKIFEPSKMLDVGCGRGTFLTYARDLGIAAQGFDFSDWAVHHPYPRCHPSWLKVHDATRPWPYMDGEFDLVTALDFYEHIYREDLDLVKEEMFRVGSRWVFLQIAVIQPQREEGYILRKEDPIPWDDARTWAGHITVQPAQFWLDLFDTDDWLPRRDIVQWFCALVDERIIANWLKNLILVLERVQ